MKKLLILGGANLHIKVVAAAKEMGLHTIVTDYLPDSPAKKIADEDWMLDIMAVDNIVDRCKKEHIDAVLGPFLDPCQRPYFEICHKLNLPCYIDSSEQMLTLTDKNVFKAACIQNGIDVIPSYTEGEKDKMDYPVIIKPSNSRSSKGQSVCFNREEFEEGCERIKNNFNGCDVVIEKYYGNHKEIGVQYLVLDGVPHLIYTLDRHRGTLQNGLERVSRGNSYPSWYTEQYRKNVNDRVISLLKNLKIKDGPVMLQGFVDGSTVRFFDMGFRFGGSEFTTLQKKYFKIDYIKMLIEFSISGKMNNQYAKVYDGIERLNGHAAICLFPVIREGKLCTIEGLDKLNSIPGVVGYTLRHKPGEYVTATGDISQRLAEIPIYGETLAQLRTSVDNVLRTIRPLDDNGENMLLGNLHPSEIE